MKMNFSDLIAKGLVKEKAYPNGLRVLKYARKVFYDNLWHVDTRLLDARGIVLDVEGEVILHPFTKVFNNGENNAGSELTAETRVIAPRKVNGFMAACRYWNGELIVSTTGSLDSDFATLARSYLEKLQGIETAACNLTLVFEICDPSDPHIVEEEAGAYLIGARFMQGCTCEGQMLNEAQLDSYAELLGAKRPEVFRGTFGKLLEQVKACQHEGWMVIDAATRETVMKIKSPHYLTKKALMRVGSRQIEVMFANPELFRERLDEEFYGVFEHILTKGKDFWTGLEEAERRAFLENYFTQE